MKRFTDTKKWEDPWFRRLSAESKLLWDWLTAKCDQAGVIDFDAEFATFQIGLKITDENVAELGTRVSKLKNGKLMVNRFVEFQYGTLSDACPAHRPVFRALAFHGIKYPFNRVSNTLQEEEKEEDKEIEKEEELPLPPGFPRSEKQAIQMAQQSGCPAPDAYIIDVWLQCRGRGGLDGANVQIRHFGSHIKKRWGREEAKWRADQRTAATATAAPRFVPDDEPELSPWEIIQAREAEMEREEAERA